GGAWGGRRSEAVEILIRKIDRRGARRQGLVEEGEQDILARFPAHLGRRRARGRSQGQPLEQRRGLGGGTLGALEADADVLVENLRTRHPAPLPVALRAVLAEAFE